MLAGGGSSLVERDVVIGHRENRGVDGGGVDGADFVVQRLPTGELTFALDVVHELFVHALVPALPGVAADHVLSGGGIEMAVGVPLVLVAAAVEEELGAGFDHLVVVEAADLEAVDAGGGAGEAGLAVVRLVSESAGGVVVAGFDETHG